MDLLNSAPSLLGLNRSHVSRRGQHAGYDVLLALISMRTPQSPVGVHSVGGL